MKSYLIASLFVSFLSFGLIFGAYGQAPLTNQEGEDLYESAMAHYHQGQYLASHTFFSRYLDSGAERNTEKASFYKLKALYLLKDIRFPSALREYLKTNKSPYYTSEAFLLGGAFYFEAKDYELSLDYYESLDLDAYNESDLFFYRGYSKYKIGQQTSALEDFEKSVFLEGDLHQAAAYYAGSLYYDNQDYSRAKEYLEKAVNDQGYAKSSNVILASIYMQEGDDSGIETMLDRSEGGMSDVDEGLYLLFGNYYFEKSKFEEASRNYERFFSLSKKASDKVYYRAGISFFNKGDHDSAAQYLKYAVLTDDTVSQISSYYLGLLYLNEGNYNYASNSFGKASRLSFNQQVSEDATFLHGKTSISAKDYVIGIEALKIYINKYPNGQHASEAKQLISEAYLKSSDLDGAITYIEGLQQKTYGVKKVYQKITIDKGIGLFNKSKFESASRYLLKAERYPQDSDLSGLANFYLGECFAIRNKFEKSISYYKNAIRKGANKTNPTVYYGLAYAYYNTQRYGDSERAFNKFKTLSDDSEKLIDSEVRIGDLAYEAKRYREALVSYDKAMKMGYDRVDYVFFQKGLVYSYNDQKEEAILNFKELINDHPASIYFDDALFQLGQIHNDASEFVKALPYFSSVIDEHQESFYVPEALLRRASIYAQKGDHDLAVKDFETMLFVHPTHSGTKGALLGLQASLSQQGKSDEFSGILSRYKSLNPKNEQLESISFEAAKEFYYAQQYQKAIKELKGYINDYPSSIHRSDAIFLIADAHFRLEQNEEAIATFKTLENTDSPSLRYKVKERLALLYYNENNFLNAEETYNYLLQNASRSKDSLKAYAGLMKSTFDLKKYDESVQFASLVLSDDRTPVYLRTGALLGRAKALLMLEDQNGAVDDLLEILNGQDQRSKAESQYLLAKIKMDARAFKESIEMLYQLKDKFPNEERWVSKSYVLLGENYLNLGELFQSRATLESVMENSPFQEDKSKAEMLLSELDSLQNSRVTQEDSLSNERIEE